MILLLNRAAEEKFIPTLYIENLKGVSMNDFTAKLKEALASLPYDSLMVESVSKNSTENKYP